MMFYIYATGIDGYSCSSLVSFIGVGDCPFHVKKIIITRLTNSFHMQTTTISIEGSLKGSFVECHRKDDSRD